MKKYLLIPLVILFFMGCGSGSSESSASSSSAFDKEAAEILNSIKENTNTQYSDWVKSGMPDSEIIPSPKGVERVGSSLRRSSNLRATPTQFSLGDFMTPVKDQGACGTCWVFAATAAVEGSYGTSSSLDFSEDHMKHHHGFYTNSSSGACSGGNIWMAMSYLSSYKGLLDETLDSYDESKNSATCSTCKPSKYVDNVILLPARKDINDNSAIKNALYYNKKPLYASVQVAYGTSGESGASVFDSDTNSFLVTTPGASANHAVLIVGWDDEYEAQGKVGAFIVKNSWGSSVGAKGYYYFPYADTTIGFGSLAYVEDVDESEFVFDNLYSHDEFGSVYAFSLESGSSIANVFTAQSDEELVGVSYYVEESDTDVEIELHKVISLEPLTTRKVGFTLKQERSLERGYHTTRFQTPPSLEANSKFAIVLEYKSSSSKVLVGVEGIAAGYSPNAQAGSSQSFYKRSGAWVDITKVRSDLNFPIKAMTVMSANESQTVEVEIAVDKEKAEVGEEINFSVRIDSSSTEISSVAWSFGDGSSSKAASVLHSYDASGNYNVDVVVTDTDGHKYSQRVRIRIIQENISSINDTFFSVYENEKANTIVGKISNNFSGPLKVELGGEDHENFAVNELAEVLIAQGVVLDYETKSFYALTVTPIDGGGVDDVKELNISVLNTSEHKPVLSNFSGSVNENASANTYVGTVRIINEGDSPIEFMTLSAEGATNFNISKSGVITVASGATLDYEATNRYSLSVKATNESGESESADVIILLLNVAETLPQLQASTATIAENSAASSNVGVVKILLSGDTAIGSITLTGNGHEDFSVDSSGNIKVAGGAVIDYEMQKEYNLSAVATNLKGDSPTVDVSISVANVAEFVPELEAFSATIAENSAASTEVGTINIVYSGDTAISTIALEGDSAEDFEAEVDGTITVASGASIDYESKNNYSLTAVATNAKGDSQSVDVNITVTDVVDVVPTLSPLILSVAENSAPLSTVGSMVIISSGDAPVSAIKLSGDDSDDFTVETDGALKVAAGASIDYESRSVYNLTAVATNSYGDSQSVNVTINIADMSDVIPILKALSTTIAENSTPLSTVASIVIFSSGDTPISAIRLEGDGATDFRAEVDGSIKVASGAMIDYESRNIYTLQAVATNLSGDSAGSDVNITISNVAEVAPEISDFDIIIYENTMQNHQLGAISIVEPGDTALSFSLTGSGSSDFSMSSDGNITVVNSLDFNRQSSYVLTVTATNDAGDDDATVSITVKDALLVATAKLKAEDPAANDYFSSAVAIRNDKIVVGSYNKSGGGAAYLFKQNDNQSYTELLKMTPDALEDGDAFGYSVGMDGIIIAVGAPKDDDNGTDAGAVYIYKYFSSDESALQIAKLKAIDTNTSDHFGSAVHVDGNIILVGAPDHNVTGSVYLFKYNPYDDTIEQALEFSATTAADGDGFGVDLDMDGSKIVVGSRSGEAAYLFSYTQITSTLAELYTFTSSDGVDGDLFGSKVSINGNYCLFGAPASNSAYMFLYGSSSPIQKKITLNTLSGDEKFGSDVALSDDAIVVGAQADDSLFVHKYNKDTFNIDPAVEIKIAPADQNDDFGSAVDIDGDIVAAAAPNDDISALDSGALFTLNLDVDNRPFILNYKPKMSVPENSGVIYEYFVESVNGLPIVLTVEGADANNFSIASDVILRAQILDYENPTDVGANNVYNITIKLTDSAGMSYSYPVVIEVIDVND